MGKRTANTRARVVHVIFVILFFIGISVLSFASRTLLALSLWAGDVTPGRENYQRTEVTVGNVLPPGGWPTVSHCHHCEVAAHRAPCFLLFIQLKIARRGAPGKRKALRKIRRKESLSEAFF